MIHPPLNIRLKWGNSHLTMLKIQKRDKSNIDLSLLTN